MVGSENSVVDVDLQRRASRAIVVRQLSNPPLLTRLQRGRLFELVVVVVRVQVLCCVQLAGPSVVVRVCFVSVAFWKMRIDSIVESLVTR